MNKFKVIIANFFLICLLLVGGCTYNCETNKSHDHSNQQIESNALKKLSPDLYEVYTKNKNENKSVNVIAKTFTPLTNEQIKELKQADINVNTISGNIFTADLPFSSIPVLAKKPYIKYVELSKTLKLLNK